MAHETEQFPDGDVIFHEGDRATKAYVVVSGTVVLGRRLTGGALTLDRVEAGEIFGEVGLLDPGPRTATAVAEGEVTLRPVEKSLFLEKVQKDPQRAFELLKTMARRLRTTDSLLTEAASRNGPPTSPKKPKKRGKRRFWPRLKRKNPPRPQICVAAISGAAGMNKQLVRALAMPQIVDVRRISGSFPLSGPPGTLHDPDLAAQEKGIRARLKKEKAEAMLWGEMDATGRFLALRITRREAPSHPTLRFLDSLDVFYLPISPGEAHLALLKGLLITALAPGTLKKPPVQTRLDTLIIQARDVGMSQRPGEAGSEQAATLSAYAGLLASLDYYASETGRLTQAEDLYAHAQKRLPAEADGQNAPLSARMGMLR